MRRLVVIMLLSALCGGTVQAKKKQVQEAEEPKALLNAELLSGLELREIGPALTSGRVSDVVVDQESSAASRLRSVANIVCPHRNANARLRDRRGSVCAGADWTA